jgi:hypothetical protein
MHNLLLVLALSLCLAGAALAQSPRDVYEINPKECGINHGGGRNRKSKYKRFLDSETADQRNWGWLVLLSGPGRRSTSGFLINSQWVLTRAKFAK